MSKQKGWIGVDLDGTLAHYDEWQGVLHIGEPIPLMQERVLKWLKEGKEVKIFTARVSNLSQLNIYQRRDVVFTINEWCKKHLGQVLEVTCSKDFSMIELWDDRAVGVNINLGTIKNEIS